MSKIAVSSNPSGTGTFTIESPATNTDRTLTLPDEAGTVLTSVSNVKQNSGAAFSYYLLSNQTVTSAVWTKIAFDTKIFDAEDDFDTSTYRFTPSIAGYYNFNLTIRQAGDTITRTNGAIYKNGNIHLQLFDTGGGYNSTTDGNFSGSGLVYLNGTTDYVEFYGRHTSSGTIFFNGSDTQDTAMQGFLVRAA